MHFKMWNLAFSLIFTGRTPQNSIIMKIKHKKYKDKNINKDIIVFPLNFQQKSCQPNIPWALGFGKVVLWWILKKILLRGELQKIEMELKLRHLPLRRWGGLACHQARFEYIFLKPPRIIHGIPKHVLHLVWIVYCLVY